MKLTKSFLVQLIKEELEEIDLRLGDEEETNPYFKNAAVEELINMEALGIAAATQEVVLGKLPDDHEDIYNNPDAEEYKKAYDEEINRLRAGGA